MRIALMTGLCILRTIFYHQKTEEDKLGDYVLIIACILSIFYAMFQNAVTCAMIYYSMSR